MKNFRINTGDEPTPEVSASLYEVGTSFRFETIAGRVKAAISIPVLILN